MAVTIQTGANTGTKHSDIRKFTLKLRGFKIEPYDTNCEPNSVAGFRRKCDPIFYLWAYMFPLDVTPADVTTGRMGVVAKTLQVK